MFIFLPWNWWLHCSQFGNKAFEKLKKKQDKRQIYNKLHMFFFFFFTALGPSSSSRSGAVAVLACFAVSNKAALKLTVMHFYALKQTIRELTLKTSGGIVFGQPVHLAASYLTPQNRGSKRMVTIVALTYATTASCVPI